MYFIFLNTYAMSATMLENKYIYIKNVFFVGASWKWFMVITTRARRLLGTGATCCQFRDDTNYDVIMLCGKPKICDATTIVAALNRSAYTKTNIDLCIYICILRVFFRYISFVCCFTCFNSRDILLDVCVVARVYSLYIYICSTRR